MHNHVVPLYNRSLYVGSPEQLSRPRVRAW